MKFQAYIACHGCDLLHYRRKLEKGGVARCSRCGTILYRHKQNSLNRTLAMAITGVILFILSISYPFLSMQIEEQIQETTIITGIIELYRQGMTWLAVLALITILVVPFLELCGLIIILLPLKFKMKTLNRGLMFRFIRHIKPWGMVEVFILGIFVSVVKLASMATIIPGIASYSFIAVMFIIAAASSSFDPEIIWEN